MQEMSQTGEDSILFYRTGQDRTVVVDWSLTGRATFCKDEYLYI